ncbi:MAG: PDZ domain-containing protein [Phycisphaeraceae bacterium]|nr:PDZ domain-containing protein [Phycisphaeraceae bacterium]
MPSTRSAAPSQHPGEHTHPDRSALCATLARAACIGLLALAGSLPMGCQAAGTGGDQRAAERLERDLRAMVTTARDRVYPALVNVSVITVSYYGGKEVKGGSTGSGAIVSPDGYIVTNQHVVSDGRRFRVTLADRRELPATLVGEDVLTDLAVLKIDPADLRPGERLPFATFGDSSRLIVGDTVMAMGSPLALSRSVTLGIVSNTERVLTSDTGDDVEELSFERGRTGIYTSWIQHDAAINPGNSGGPLVNLRGEIVGINTIKVGLSGIGLAIPSTLVRPVYEELVADGQVRRSSIGVAFKSIKRSGFSRGVMVNSVSGNSPAERAGLRAGDLVTALNGEPVTVRFAEEVPVFARRIADMPIGSDLTLTYERAGVTHTASITTEQLHKETGDASALRLWGISVREITPQMARDFLLDDTRGVMVTGTRPGGPAETAEPPLFPGDILRAADGRTIDSLRDSVAHYREIMDASPVPERILIEFERRGKSFVTLIRPRPDRRDDPPREVPKAWIGVHTQVVLRDLAGQLGTPEALGFRITRVYPGTLAAQSDLRTGDIITAINGERFAPRSAQEAGAFVRRVNALPVSRPATLTIVRDGKAIDVEVPLERTRITREEAIKDQNRDFDLTVRELTFFDRDDYRWSQDTQGVIVEGIERAGWAGLAGVTDGDLIQRIGDADITDIASYRAAMDAISKAQPSRVTFLVLRGSRTFFLFAEPDWKPQTRESAAQEETAEP